MTKRLIRDIKYDLDQLRANYEARRRELEDELKITRRPSRRKKSGWEHYYEPGRDRMPTPSGGLGGGWDGDREFYGPLTRPSKCSHSWHDEVSYHGEVASAVRVCSRCGKKEWL